jgi:hypothetical protein
MKLFGVLGHKVRGFRVLDLAAMAIFLALAFTVYAFKTTAGRERSDIADIEEQIRDESRQVRLLQAKVSKEESPANLERLSKYAGQAPIDPKQEVPPEALSRLAQQGAAP